LASSCQTDVIIPHLNYGKFLRQCLDSIQKQNVPKNIILIDGGSTDDTFEILKDYPEIQVYRNFQGEVRDIFVYGFQQSNSEYVIFFSSDNIMMPDFLEKAKAVLDADKQVGMTYGYAMQINENGKEQGRIHGGAYSQSRLRMANFIDSSEGVFRREAWNGVYPNWLVCHPDWYIWLKISEQWKIVDLNCQVIYFRVHDNSFSNRRRSDIDREYGFIRALAASGRL